MTTKVTASHPAPRSFSASFGPKAGIRTWTRLSCNDWKEGETFDDSAWLSCTGSPGGVGFESASGYEDLIGLDLNQQMYARNATCYIRIPFTVEDDSKKLTTLTLKARYDDGFVAYLNGVEVARRNFSGTPAWKSRASTSHSDLLAVQFESIDISASFSLLREGGNVLAIHGMNSSTTNGDFLISVELVAGTVPSARLYTEPITLDHSTEVKARAWDGNAWSALNDATYAVGPIAESLRISEIMYHPLSGEGIPPLRREAVSASPLKEQGQDALATEEFIELTNVGTESINLNLVRFTNGIDFTFPNVELAPGEYVVAVQDRDAFQARYGLDVYVTGQYSGRLDNAGERIRLEDALGRMVLDFNYSDVWRSLTDGEGFSLALIDPANPDVNTWGEKDAWRPSAHLGGSPGWDDSGILPVPGSVVINEVLAHSHAEDADWIELYNAAGHAIDVGGWFLSDSGDNPFKYEIAPGTTIDAGGYLVFREDTHFGNRNNPGCREPFALSENGETLYLSSARNGALTGYREAEDFGASITDVSFGRYYKPDTGNTNFVAMEYITPGFTNTYPKIGPVIISEIMYNPDWPDGGPYTNDQYEYIELRNISIEPVTLYNPNTSEPWKFTSGIDFAFPTDPPATIPAGGCLLVARHSQAFLLRYPGVPVETVLGSYDGQLSNAGENIELSMPGDVDAAGVRHYIRVDRVNYSDGSHPQDCPGQVDLWPVEADGFGLSLTRRILADYGNDADNWIAGVPSPGE
ncbi:MAG: lamin tail domain-containing protein [Sedimentisphaerales bacterium]